MPVLGFKLEVNDGLNGEIFTELAGYPTSGMYPLSYEMTVVSDSLVVGRIYAIRWRAFNSVGDGPASDEILVALADDFVAPTGLTKDYINSSKTVISMSWQAITPGTAPGGNILGYLLQVEDTNTGTKWIAFDGFKLGLPSQLRASVSNLVIGRDYKFSVAAKSFNGIGAWSTPVTYFACVAPGEFSAPARVTSTINSITIQWNHPSNDGGCSVRSFAVWCDDGQGGAFVEVNSDQDTQVRNKPGLTSLLITSPFSAGNLEGRDFRIYVTAFNNDGSTNSEIATIRLGDVPLAPTSKPVKLQAMSSTSSIAVQIAELPQADHEGLAVDSYCLEIDSNLDGVF